MSSVPRRKPGGSLRATATEIGDLTAFTGQVLRALPGSLRFSSELLRQFAILVRGTTPLLVVFAFAISSGLMNFGYYFLRSAGASDYTGLLAGIGIPRATAAMTFGYIFAAKVGCGIVAELGSMRINQELDAYDTEGVGSIRYVLAPRVLASALYAPVAAAVVLVSAMVSCYLIAVFVLNAVSTETFFRYAWGNQAVFDQFFAIGVIFAIAFLTVLVSVFFGYHTRGGPAGVGAAVARSLVFNLVIVHMVIGLAALAVYGTDLGLPVGG